MGTGLTGAQRHTAFMLRTHTIKGLRCTCHSLPRLQGPQRVHQLALPRRKCQRLAAHAQFAGVLSVRCLCVVLYTSLLSCLLTYWCGVVK